MGAKTIKAGLPSGFRDLLPEMAAKKRWLIEQIIYVYERFGFLPLETPIVEFEETLTGNNPDFNMNIFQIAGSGEKLAMRFDLTVPLARVMAQYPELIKPFKRYQLGTVLRGEKAQRGRYRGFDQLDFDILGPDSILADVEIINIIYDVMMALGINDFLIRVNTRKILNALPFYAGFNPDKLVPVLRIMDKLDKIGLGGVIQALKAKPEFEGHFENPGLSQESVDKIVEFLSLQGDSEEIISELDTLMREIPEAQEGLEELKGLYKFLKSTGINPNNWKIDLSVARGLDYYTGPVFETMLTKKPELGSICSGGRFDGLVSRFGNIELPATGASFGIDRLIDVLGALGYLDKISVIGSQILVTSIDKNLSADYIQIASSLREGGLRTEVYLGKEDSLRGQLGYANKKGIPFVLIYGSDEASSGRVKLKEMQTGEQKSISLTNLVAVMTIYCQ